MTNEELCERVLPNQMVGEDSYPCDCREDLKKALAKGILIPAEKMLTVEELYDFIVKYENKRGGFTGPQMRLAEAIHAQMTGGKK